jgi:hypothetical protein
LRADVDRFEQVRLARTVRPRHEHHPRLERKLQARVRADVAKRDRLDDQRLAGKPDRHDQVPEVVALGGDQPWAER